MELEKDEDCTYHTWQSPRVHVSFSEEILADKVPLAAFVAGIEKDAQENLKEAFAKLRVELGIAT